MSLCLCECVSACVFVHSCDLNCEGSVYHSLPAVVLAPSESVTANKHPSGAEVIESLKLY